jgi:hypothetical protein
MRTEPHQRSPKEWKNDDWRGRCPRPGCDEDHAGFSLIGTASSPGE